MLENPGIKRDSDFHDTLIGIAVLGSEHLHLRGSLGFCRSFGSLWLFCNLLCWCFRLYAASSTRNIVKSSGRHSYRLLGLWRKVGALVAGRDIEDKVFSF